MAEINEPDEVEEGEEAEPSEPPVLITQEEVRAELCRMMAQRVLRDHAITAPPVPVDRIATNLGFELHLRDLPHGVDARLRTIDTRKVIELARDQAEVRRRFSIGHELGHHFLGHRHGEHKAAEIEASIFAGELLVPRAWLRRDVDHHRIAELTIKYNVSRDVLFRAADGARLVNRLVR